MVVFVVGIFDFSGAFTLKQRLANAAREGARAAAADPATDLSNGTPVSVSDAFQVVNAYLKNNNVNICGLTNSGTQSGLTWTFSASSSGPPPCSITLVVNRGYYFPGTGAGTPSGCTSQAPGQNGTAVIATCVNLQYGYQWHFGSVIKLLGSSSLPSTLTTTAVAFNEN
jgi:Flp pilus assembly protein TadG